MPELHILFCRSQFHANLQLNRQYIVFWFVSQKSLCSFLADLTPPVLVLTPPLRVTVEAVLGSFREPGFTAFDFIDGNVTSRVVPVNSVNISAPGVYNITYLSSDLSFNEISAIRTVDVVDSTPPVLTLLGRSNDTVDFGLPYNDLGVEARDAVDGLLTDIRVANSSLLLPENQVFGSQTRLVCVIFSSSTIDHLDVFSPRPSGQWRFGVTGGHCCRCVSSRHYFAWACLVEMGRWPWKNLHRSWG
jgi:hypothetical protein